MLAERRGFDPSDFHIADRFGAGDVLARRVVELVRGAQQFRRHVRQRTKWGLAEGRVGGTASHTTYILLANPEVDGGNRPPDVPASRWDDAC